MLVGDYSDEYDRIPKTKYIGDEAAVAYLCLEYIMAVGPGGNVSFFLPKCLSEMGETCLILQYSAAQMSC